MHPVTFKRFFHIHIENPLCKVYDTTLCSLQNQHKYDNIDLEIKKTCEFKQNENNPINSQTE